MGFCPELFLLISSLDTICANSDGDEKQQEINTRDDLYVCAAAIVAYIIVSTTVKLLNA